MSEEQLLVTLGVKDANCTSKLKELNKEIKSLDTVYNKTSKTSKDFEKSTEGLKTKLEYLNKKYDANKAKLSAYKEQMQKAKDMLAKKREELEKLKNSEEQNATAIQKSEKQLETYQTQLNNASRNINETEAELGRLKTEITETNTAMASNAIKDYSQKMEQLEQKITGAGEKIQQIGDGISSLGSSLMKLSAPFIAFAGYATKTAMSFEQDMANLQATSGATGKDFEALTNKAKELGENTCKSASDSAQAMQYLALAGYDVNQILSSTEPILKASVAWGSDMARSADLATDSMSALGMSTDQLTHYLDVCSQAQRSSNTTATALMEAYIVCGGSLKNLNVPLEESATLLGVLANQGLKGSQAGNSLNSILINLMGVSETAAKALDKIGVSAWDSKGKFIGFENTLIQLKNKTKDMTEEERNFYLALIGGKTQIDTLNKLLAGVGDQYTDLSGKMNQASGATEEMYSIMNNTSKGKIEAFKSKLEALGIQVGDKLLPHLNKLVDKAMELVDWFGNLDEGTQSLILKTGFITLATGGLLKIVGGLTSGFGKLVTMGGKAVGFLGKLKTASFAASTGASALGSTVSTAETEIAATTAKGTKMLKNLSLLKEASVATGGAWIALGTAVKGATTINDLHNKSILEATDNMSAFEKAINWVDGSFHKSKEELQDMGLIYKDFNENVSVDFQNKINECADEVKSLNTELRNTTLDGVITEEETNGVVKRVKDMHDKCIEAISSKSKESSEAIKKAFSADGVITSQEQQVLDAINSTYDDATKVVEQRQTEINDLIKHRTIDNAKKTDEAIVEKTKQINEAYLQVVASNQEELEAVHINFRERARNYDAQSASEYLVKKRAEYEELSKATKEHYDEGLSQLEEMIERTTGEKQKMYQNEYDILKKQRDNELKKNKKYFLDFYDELVKSNSKIAEHINMITGEIMSETEEKNQKALLNMSNTYDGLNNITESGCYNLYNQTTGTMEKVGVVVDEETGKIVGVYENGAKTTGECLDGAGKKAKEFVANTENATTDIVECWKYMANCTVNSSDQLVSKNGEIINSLISVKNNLDSTRIAIVSINGQPIAIKINGDGQVIQTLNSIAGKIISLTDKTFTISMEMRQNWHSDGRGGVYVPEGYASGTSDATKGIHLVGENGPELVYFRGGETVLNAEKTRNIITSGGYLNPHTVESTQLLNTSNVYNNNTYNNSSIDMNALGNIIANAVTSAISSLSIQMDTQKVAEIVDNQNGRNVAWERRFNGC